MASIHRKWRHDGEREPEDIIWSHELTPDLSLDWSVMRANKFLLDLTQSVLGLGLLLVIKGVLTHTKAHQRVIYSLLNCEHLVVRD